MSDVAEGASLLERSTRVVLRPLGNPLPLGFLALVAATSLIACLQLEYLDVTDGSDVALILIVFVAPLQALSSVLGFLARDVVAGTGMGLLAGTWLSIGVVLLRSPPGATSDALGLLLLVAALAMCVPATGALTGKLVPAAVLFTTAIRFAVTGVYELSGNSTSKVAAGIVGLTLAALALYAASAMLLEDVRRQTVLPLLRRSEGKTSMTGNLSEQLAKLEREAGVREQL
jgi:uncharacterized protein